MKILKVYPSEDTPQRHNYRVNYGVWAKIKGDAVQMENFNVDPGNYDVIFLPQFKRWKNKTDLLSYIKNSRAKKVLFDNDSCYRSFDDPFYEGLDYIFYRDVDKNKETPGMKSSWLPWSVDTEYYTPVYGGEGIVFNCSVSKHYPLRTKISELVNNTRHQADDYVMLLQQAAGAIHTDSPIVPVVRAKALEFAACGTHIISNRTQKMEFFFPEDLVVYFDSVDELKNIINNFKPNMETQKKLREITVEMHDDKVRATQITNILTGQI